ncbi:MAG: tRNA guanosine(15) transglycosylase TgtA [Candidatus Lokiarchaeota archaeon]|nr:tRNA guanosine(15) transglycosylase TgtA [Candidatus Lokiarchaeota archaeon]
MKWEITDIDALGRIGKLIINDKEMVTPNLFPVVHPYRNLLNLSDLKDIGAQCVFTNAYIIYQNSEIRDIVLSKGLHKYLNFDGIIATDSGAFQKYMYNKTDFELNAEDIEKFQEDIGSDFPVILDEPVQPDDNYETAKKKVDLSIQRAKDNIIRRVSDTCHWFGPIHGAKYMDLLELSTVEMSKLDFDVYAIGGLVKSLLNYRFDLVIKTLLRVKENIVWNKPVHMFGLGLPQFFSLAVACGCDLMDSAAYILFAKENRYFTLSTGTRNLEELEEFPCHCPICCEYKPKEVLNFDSNLRTELLAKHNLYLSFSELRTIRQAIKEGNLWELVEQRIRNHPRLVDAFGLVKSKLELFEKHENVYKPKGRLYSSPESIHRPLLHRYDLRIKNNYRVPSEAKYLILLPELDVKGSQSPSIKSWLEEIENNAIIPRESLHIAFISDFFGILPLDLSSTFPMGQYESISRLTSNNKIYNKFAQRVENFFKFHGNHYTKCSILTPDRYINQFNEEIEYSKKETIISIFNKLKSKLVLNCSIFEDIPEILQFFKDD